MNIKTSLKSLIAFLIKHFNRVVPLFFTQSILLRFFGIHLRIVNQQLTLEFREITVCKYKNGAKGAFCFSIDYDFPVQPRNVDDIETIFSKAVGNLIDLSEKYHIPITWGICGETAIQNINLFKRIGESIIPHDLGVHTYSHLDLSNSDYTAHEIRQDISQCIESINTHDQPTSFIFPWNREKHWDLLRDLGFIAYRGKINGFRTIGPPDYHNKLWNISETYYLNEKSIDEVPIICSLIDIAIAYQGVFHLWSHPWNLHKFGDVHNYQKNVTQPIMEHISTQRDMNKLWICTMQEMAYYSEARRRSIIKDIEISDNETKFSIECQIEDNRYVSSPMLTIKVKVPLPYDSLQVFLDHDEVLYGNIWWKNREEPQYIFINICFEHTSLHVLIKHIAM
ncbi:MAG: polysaccharide deacetylase family protein [Candidatus Bathyarchaeota archaeon]|nr:MAG: polysaccharide deacetylase family protein [Candidatus Bathyarchaeota archaeon]